MLVGMGTIPRSLFPGVGGGREDNAGGGEEVDRGVETCGHRPRSYYSVWDRVRLGFRGRARGEGGDRDVEAGEDRGTTKDGEGAMKGLARFAGRIKRQKGAVVAEASQLDTLVGEEDGVRPITEKAGARDEVRQATSSPVPRNPPIAYHYPVRVQADCCW